MMQKPFPCHCKGGRESRQSVLGVTKKFSIRAFPVCRCEYGCGCVCCVCGRNLPGFACRMPMTALISLSTNAVAFPKKKRKKGRNVSSLFFHTQSLPFLQFFSLQTSSVSNFQSFSCNFILFLFLMRTNKQRNKK